MTPLNVSTCLQGVELKLFSFHSCDWSPECKWSMEVTLPYMNFQFWMMELQAKDHNLLVVAKIICHNFFEKFLARL